MPTAPNTLAGLLIQQTQSAIYSAGLSIATSLGLPVTSWAPGDPTRSLFYLESNILSAVENVVVGYIQSAFLDYAAVPNSDGTPNPWLAILAYQVYGVTVPTATYATTTVTLTNTGGGVYVLEPGDISFLNSTTGATYTSTTAVTLTGVGTAGATGSVTVVADTSGSAGSANAGEIDTVTSGYLGVTCSNAAAAVGTDAQDPQTTVSQCRNKLGALSPNGPAAAYTYVALNSTLTGTTNVTRARTYPDSQNGQFPIYVAGPGGAVGTQDVNLVQLAVNQWAAPQCFQPTVISATNVVVNVAYTINVYESVNQTPTQIEAAIQAALEAFFAARPIGGDIIPPSTSGYLFQSMIESLIGSVYPTKTIQVTLTSPSSDTALTNGQVAALGTITATVSNPLIPDPT